MSVDEDMEDALKVCWEKGYNYEETSHFIERNVGQTLSVRQIKYLMKRLGLTRNDQCSLMTVRSTIQTELQTSRSLLGYRGMWRRLRRKYHLRVCRDRVMTIMRELDPEGVQQRKKRRFKRGLYRSVGPNQTWHLDGNDKLSPWGIGIHGCIDGKLIWLKAASTNREPAVIANYYLSAVKEYRGCPQMVRMDRGTENVTVGALHSYFRRDMDAIIYGRSTANQRIEQHWAVLKRSWTNWWRNLFAGLTHEGDHLDKGLVQYCFLSIINEELESYRQDWNSHRIRSQVHNLVPSGVPDVLFDMPYLYGYSNALQNIDPDDILTVEDQCRDPPSGNSEINEYLDYVVNREALFRPASPDLSKHLYCMLRPFLRS